MPAAEKKRKKICSINQSKKVLEYNMGIELMAAVAATAKNSRKGVCWGNFHQFIKNWIEVSLQSMCDF